MDKYEARIKNAKAIHDRIVCLLDKGFMIWDELGQTISKVEANFAANKFSWYTNENSLWLEENGATTLFFGNG